MTKATARTSTDIIQSIDRRLRVLEGSRKLRRNADGDIDFGTGIDLGDGSRIDYGGSIVDPPTDLVLEPGASLNVIYVDIEWTPFGSVATAHDVSVVNNTTGVTESRTTVGGTSTRISGLEPNVLYDVYVRATDNLGRTSLPLSGQFTSVGDTEEPPEVTGLTVTAGVRSLVAIWDESTADDVKNGRGLYEAELWSDDAGSPDALLRTSRTSGTIISWVDLSGSTTYHARLRAIDSSGNEGPFGAFGSATTAEAGGRDFTTDPILETEIADDSISTPKLQANSINAGKLVTDEAVITGTAQIADAIINNAKIISLSAEKITFGVMSGDRIEANTLDVNRLKTSTLSARTITLASNGRLLANGASGSLYLDGQGIRLFSAPNGGGSQTVFLDAATGNASFTGVINATSGSFTGSVNATSGNISGNMNLGGILTATTGGGIRTASSGLRVELGNSMYGVIESGQLVFRNPGGSIRGLLERNSLQSVFWVRALNGDGLNLDSSNVIDYLSGNTVLGHRWSINAQEMMELQRMASLGSQGGVLAGNLWGVRPVLPMNSRSPGHNTVPFPDGWSAQICSGSQGWPANGLLLMNNWAQGGGHRAWQMFHPKTVSGGGSPSTIYYRTRNSDDTGWFTWREITSTVA